MSKEEASKIVESYGSSWLALPGVEAVGIGEKGVHVYWSGSAEPKTIPAIINGVEIIKIQSGPFNKQGDPTS